MFELCIGEFQALKLCFRFVSDFIYFWKEALWSGPTFEHFPQRKVLNEYQERKKFRYIWYLNFNQGVVPSLGYKDTWLE